jgi:hypothetical protein
MIPGALDIARCEALADRSIAGDRDAWQELIAALWPAWLRHVRSSRAMGPLARSDDHVHDVLAKLVEKLGDRERQGLKRYRPWKEKNPDKTFEDWIHIVAARAVLDHVRSHLGQSKASRSPDEPSLKRLLNEFAASPALAELGVRPPITATQTARELLEFARTRLPPDQYEALALWADKATFEEIDEEIEGIEAGQGKRLMRAAVATLRRHFARTGDESEDESEDEG